MQGNSVAADQYLREVRHGDERMVTKLVARTARKPERASEAPA